MRKLETPEKLAARKAKEQKELEKWRKEQQKPKHKFYLLYLLVVLSLVFIMDSIATDICTKMKAEICQYLFDGSTAVMDLLGMLASAVMIAGAIYKSMADRFGRKIFLVLNTIAMGFGMLIVYIAGALGSATVYIIGSLLITFFIAHDMQAVYVLETMPANRRFTYLSIVSAIASFGTILIPALRRALMGNNTELWNQVFLVPAILAAVVGLIAMVTARETDAFIQNRIAFLQKTDEEREAEKAQRKAEAQAQGGLLPAFKFAFRHKQLRWLFARHFNMISDFGKALDPLADKLTQAALLICLLAKYKLMWGLIVVFGVCELGKFALGIAIAKKYDEVTGAKWYGKVNTVVIYITMMVLILLSNINIVYANILIGVCGMVMIIAHVLYFHLYFGILGKKAKCKKVE